MYSGYIDIIFLAALAVFIFWRLRAVLGKNVEIDRKPVSKGNTIMLPTGLDKSLQHKNMEKEEETKKQEEEKSSYPAELMAKVALIQKLDPSFTLSKFLKGASGAFELILNAVSAGDLKTLKRFTAPGIYDDFAALVQERLDKKLKSNSTIIAITKTEPQNIVIDNSTALISVRFVSEQINFVKNEAGEVVEGDPKHVDVVEDIWTFERNLKSSDPNWLLTDA